MWFCMSATSTPLIIVLFYFIFRLSGAHPTTLNVFIVTSTCHINLTGIIIYKIYNGLLPQAINVLDVRNKITHSHKTMGSNLLSS